MEQFLGGLQVLLQWQNFLIIPVGLAIGIIVGAIPGLTSDLGLILCIPLTYGMDPTMAILMLLAIYCGGTYGGSITAILINTPGTSANAATLFDGYPMTQRGQAFKALQMALYASTIGGLISAFALLFLAPQIAKITLLFGPAEYFEGTDRRLHRLVHGYHRHGQYQRHRPLYLWKQSAHEWYRPDHRPHWTVCYL